MGIQVDQEARTTYPLNVAVMKVFVFSYQRTLKVDHFAIGPDEIFFLLPLLFAHQITKISLVLISM